MLTIVDAIAVSANDTITEPWDGSQAGDVALFVWYDMITSASAVIDEEESTHTPTPYTRVTTHNGNTIYFDYRLLDGTEPQGGGGHYVQLPTFAVGMHIVLRHPDGDVISVSNEASATTLGGDPAAQDLGPLTEEVVQMVLVQGTGGAGSIGATPDDGWMGNSGIFGGAQDGAGVRTMADAFLRYNDTVTDYGITYDRSGTAGGMTVYGVALGVHAGSTPVETTGGSVDLRLMRLVHEDLPQVVHTRMLGRD